MDGLGVFGAAKNESVCLLVVSVDVSLLFIPARLALAGPGVQFCSVTDQQFTQTMVAHSQPSWAGDRLTQPLGFSLFSPLRSFSISLSPPLFL
jgi:hypothetical protein